VGILSFKTIYTWLYHGLLNRGNLCALRQKGKRRELVETRGKFAVGQTIADRPEEVKDREPFGHWELDTVVSGRGQSKGCFATFLERKSRHYTAIMMPDRSAASMENESPNFALQCPSTLSKQRPRIAAKSSLVMVCPRKIGLVTVFC